MVFSEDEKMQLASIHLAKFNWSRVVSSADVPPDLTKLDVEVAISVHKLRVMVLQAVIERALVRHCSTITCIEGIYIPSLIVGAVERAQP